ncbi:MAG: class I SAM-dependent methyltransferase [Caldiserica bacterium]|nr:class I SAM-dependent methyltransferase [Caldisericota bacterium]
MESSYTAPFAQAYNQRWTGFVTLVGPRLRTLYEQVCPHGEHSVLDVCCGTGQLALQFLQAGYTVTGLDNSEPMLAHARMNCASFVSSGEVSFVQGDAADFSLSSRFGLALSTFDALNHLSDTNALLSCFACVHQCLLPGGLFAFDLNTVLGLRRWNNVTVEDALDAMVINRGMYDEDRRQGRIKISGFVRQESGGWLRFDETFVESAWPVREVTTALLEVGFSAVYQARAVDLAAPLADPESEPRVFFVARV